MLHLKHLSVWYNGHIITGTYKILLLKLYEMTHCYILCLKVYSSYAVLFNLAMIACIYWYSVYFKYTIWCFGELFMYCITTTFSWKEYEEYK